MKIPEGFQPIETAPKDRPIVGLCIHEADPYTEDGGRTLTVYGAHCEGLSHVPDGLHVIEWGGEYLEQDFTGATFSIPAWWFRSGSDFEEVANPVAWMDLPKLR